jgi:hypothetical protein
MELKEFVKTVIKELSEGMKEVQEEVEGVVINPKDILINTQGGTGLSSSRNDKSPVTILRFEIGLTESKVKKNTGGMGVFLGSVNMGAKRESETNDDAITRISFSIPVLFEL